MLQVKHKGGDSRVIDAHPLLKEYFAEKLQDGNPEAWREGNRRLYEFLTTGSVDKKTTLPVQPNLPR